MTDHVSYTYSQQAKLYFCVSKDYYF
jgi:hypothetical protein